MSRAALLTGLGRIAAGGVVAAIVVALGGWTLERARFGRSDTEALARVQAGLQRELDTIAGSLRSVAERVAAQGDAIRNASRDAAAATRLFDAVEAAIPAADSGRIGITVYDTLGMPLAWAGQVSELTRERLDSLPMLHVATGGPGPRLVRLEPVVDLQRRSAQRLATIVAEQALGPADAAPALGDRLALPTVLGPAILAPPGAADSPRPWTFTLRGAGGIPLVEAQLPPGEPARARAAWRQRTMAAVLAVIALTFLVVAGRLVERRRLARGAGRNLAAAAGIAAALGASRAVLAVASQGLPWALNLLLTSLVTVALVWLVIGLIEGRRTVRPHAAVLTPGARSAWLAVVACGITGLAVSLLLAAYGRVLQAVVARTTTDLLHFSLHPLDATRLALAFGLVLLHAAAVWTAAALSRLPTLRWRMPRGMMPRLAGAAWLAGALLGLSLAGAAGVSLPATPLLPAVAAAGACAAALARLRVRARRATQTMRLGALLAALLGPALAMYPALLAVATQAKERLVADTYGPQALSLRRDLEQRLYRTLDQIDALNTLPAFVDGASSVDAPSTDRGFLVWSRTDLARYRLTSAVELYRNDGRLVSRFTLLLPEYATTRYDATGCDWDLSDDVSWFGASERHVLRASRGICVSGQIAGGIVVRAMLDYRMLPFTTSQNPYLESLRPDRQASSEDVLGRDVEFAAYGWSRAPLYPPGTSVWTLPDATFTRMTASREPFWEAVERDGRQFRVYFLNDRGGIYALGYPVTTLWGHVINLAELVTLTFALYVLAIGGATLFNLLTSRTPASGRALLREIRSSFYRKLFLAFLAATVAPVATLAFATRTYFATELDNSIDEAGAQTATVAQRLVEDYATLQQRGSASVEALDDEIMVLVSRAINEDVNLFDRSRLQATSQRDLFASQLLSTRTPGDAYRKLLLDRAPVYLGVQQVGGFAYRVAAAPVRAGGRETIVTVPLALRNQDVERQIDELDRRVLFGAVLFSLLGGALGYGMAERIADPVSRLTRATRRVARGDLDARIAAASSDELGRLVADFNQMAADLQQQRIELERTQRLEAWAAMARQVAHDIKNPLTPIQLSAEHARRVNLDRGRPLSPVLDDCVSTILGQVALLRQISAEFSSFASSPTPHPVATDLGALVDEVVAPYRTGLERIAIDVQAEPRLPQPMVDRTLLGRALTNVIENALHAMPGRGRLTIAVRLEPDAARDAARETDGFRRSVMIHVADTGVGMDEEALAKAFEPYFSSKATGTGLGLTIAKRNVELNGGTIHVASRPGTGTTVTIALPV